MAEHSRAQHTTARQGTTEHSTKKHSKACTVYSHITAVPRGQAIRPCEPKEKNALCLFANRTPTTRSDKTTRFRSQLARFHLGRYYSSSAPATSTRTDAVARVMLHHPCSTCSKCSMNCSSLRLNTHSLTSKTYRTRYTDARSKLCYTLIAASVQRAKIQYFTFQRASLTRTDGWTFRILLFYVLHAAQ